MKETVIRGLDSLNLNSDCADKLCTFGRRLVEKNKVMNLTGITEDVDVANLHFLDCACLLGACDFNGKSVIDVGTGAGFPGVPIKIIQPDMKLTLLDSLAKRIDFLKEACIDLGFDDTDFVHARAEEFAATHREGFDIATSRAVAALPMLCELSLPMVKIGGYFLAMKSVDTDHEIKSAEKAIEILGGKFESCFDYTIPFTDISHRVVKIKKIKKSPAKYPRRFAMIKKSPL